MEHSLADLREHATRTTASRHAPRAPRHDVYAMIHKALRLAMSDVLVRVGRLDAEDGVDVRATATAVRELVGLCRMHLDKEEKFVHPALEAAVPGGAGRTAREHDDHLAAAGARRLTRGSAAAYALPRQATRIVAIMPLAWCSST